MNGLVVKGLRKHFHSGGGFLGGPKVTIRAVEDVSVSVPPGTSVGLVGESGCGKSTVVRLILRLMEPDAGSVTFGEQDVRGASPSAMRKLRRRMQVIFQDPYSSLNGRRTIRQTLEEPLKVHNLGSRAEIAERAATMLAEVGLSGDSLDRYPHEFSGGQRQRIGIARALVLEPDLIIADEPVSALDVSVQAQILRLLDGLKTRRNLSFLFVSHDLAVVRHFCSQTLVMYLGRVVEAAPTEEIMDRPAHPYTMLLRQSSPIPDPAIRLPELHLDGDLPSPAAPPAGCPFHTRCPRVVPICSQVLPEMKSIAPGHTVACHLY